jgi:hypothetical protein
VTEVELKLNNEGGKMNREYERGINKLIPKAEAYADIEIEPYLAGDREMIKDKWSELFLKETQRLAVKAGLRKGR